MSSDLTISAVEPEKFGIMDGPDRLMSDSLQNDIILLLGFTGAFSLALFLTRAATLFFVRRLPGSNPVVSAAIALLVVYILPSLLLAWNEPPLLTIAIVIGLPIFIVNYLAARNATRRRFSEVED